MSRTFVPIGISLDKEEAERRPSDIRLNSADGWIESSSRPCKMNKSKKIHVWGQDFLMHCWPIGVIGAHIASFFHKEPAELDTSLAIVETTVNEAVCSAESEVILIDPDHVRPETEWAALQTCIEQARKKLKVLSNDLEASWVKPRLLGSEGYDSIKNKIKQSDHLIVQTEEAATAVKSANTSANLDRLAKVIKDLRAAQDSIVLQPDSPQFKLLKEISLIFAGLVSILWSLAVRMAILAPTSPLVLWAPAVAGLGLIFVRVGRLVKIHIVDEKRLEDARGLFEIHGSLIPILEGIKQRMDANKITAMIQTSAQQQQKKMENLEAQNVGLQNQVGEILSFLKSSKSVESTRSASEAAEASGGNLQANEALRTFVEKRLEENASKEAILEEVEKMIKTVEADKAAKSTENTEAATKSA